MSQFPVQIDIILVSSEKYDLGSTESLTSVILPSHLKMSEFYSKGFTLRIFVDILKRKKSREF